MYIHKLKQCYNNSMFSEGICGEKFTGGVPIMTIDNNEVTCPECLKLLIYYMDCPKCKCTYAYNYKKEKCDECNVLLVPSRVKNSNKFDWDKHIIQRY